MGEERLRVIEDMKTRCGSVKSPTTMGVKSAARLDIFKADSARCSEVCHGMSAHTFYTQIKYLPEVNQDSAIVIAEAKSKEHVSS